MGNVIILTGADKKSQRVFNSKFNMYNKYIKYNFV